MFSKKYLKCEFIDITQSKGVSNVIIFKDMAANIIKKKYIEAKEKITETAADLIKAEIRERKYSNEIYPTTDNMLKTGCLVRQVFSYFWN